MDQKNIYHEKMEECLVKRYTELTEDELAALTNEQVESYVDLECAMEKIPFLPVLPEAPVKPNMNPGIPMYKVFSVVLKTQEDANRIFDVVNSCSVYKIEGYGNQPKVATQIAVGDYDYPKIEIVHITDPNSINEFNKVMSSYNIDKDAYEKMYEEYSEIKKERNKVSDKVSDAVTSARASVKKKSTYRETYNKYLGLASGIPDIAIQFMLDAYPDIQMKYPELIEEFAPGYTARCKDV
jgi:hypothetical protein